jgi:hypothetical protein
MGPTAKDAAQALKPKEVIFGLTLQNIPTINLRQQYAQDRKIVFDQGFDSIIDTWKTGRMPRPVTVSYPEPDAFFTTLFRTTIVGIECTLQAAAIEELAFSRRLTNPLHELLLRPGKLAPSMAEAYYNKIPEKVNSSARLRIHDGKLWKQVRKFYEEVSNPISHGHQLSNVKPTPLRAAFTMFDQIYGWIDTWSNRSRIHKILATTTFKPLK